MSSEKCPAMVAIPVEEYMRLLDVERNVKKSRKGLSLPYGQTIYLTDEEVAKEFEALIDEVEQLMRICREVIDERNRLGGLMWDHNHSPWFERIKDMEAPPWAKHCAKKFKHLHDLRP